jgi:HEAT repeat protein
MHSWEGDPRLKPTPDVGSLGPTSDLRPRKPVDPQMRGVRVVAAVVAGVLMATVFMAAKSGVAQAAWDQVAQFLSLRGKPEPASPAIMSEHELERLDQQNAQSQAELLLERAVNHYEGANDQIAARVDGWRGRLKLSTQLNSLITTALNSNDLRVRAAAIEVDLAAMGVAKNSESVDRFAQQAESGAQSQRVWALWMLGLLGNRGVEPQRVNQILVSQLRDSDQEIRHWAVEGLAYLGTDDTIAPLLQTFHDDPSPMVRERAACSLAQSGMLSQEQRRSVVPQLLNFAEDASLDAQTHTWVYEALRDITGQNLPNDPGAWRNWNSTATR